MSLDADTLLDRLHLKSQISRWRTLAITAGVLLLVAVFGDVSAIKPIEGDYIAKVSIEDLITTDEDLLDKLEDLKEDERAKAVIIELDTPGGTAVGGEELYLAIRAISESGKPTVALMRTLCTSAGYMAALGTDHIIAREGTLTGSIGVILQTAELTELAEKLGVQPITIKSAPLKGSPSPFEKFTAREREAMESVVKDFFRYFVNLLQLV